MVGAHAHDALKNSCELCRPSSKNYINDQKQSTSSTVNPIFLNL